MDLTKGMECPSCGIKSSFMGGSFGGGINTTNFKCECGFTAFIVITKDEFEYGVYAENKDKIKANPYKDIEKDKLIIKKHYFEEALEHATGHIYSELGKHISFIKDLIK